jgi:hypothetical protein
VQSISRAFAFVCVSGLLAACGGSEPEPKEPSSEAPSAAAEKPAKSDTDMPAEASGDSKKEAPKAEEASAAPAEKMPVKTLKDVLTTPGALFVFSFSASDVHQAAEDQCAKSAKDDPKKKADCMSKASAKLEGDAFQFQEQGDNKGVWLTMQRKGDKLTTKQKREIVFGKETDKTITVTEKGKDVVIEVPSEGQIVLTDPKLGKMVYELKLGLVGEQQR